MAIEGSLSLPIFLFFMMTMLLSLEAVRLQSNVMEALYQAGNEYAFSACQMKYVDVASPKPEKRVVEYLDSQLYPYLCMAEGKEGISLQDVSDVSQSGRIELTAQYRLKPFIDWLPIGEILIEDRFFSHGWIGYTGMDGESSKAQEIYVYITKTGSKYHLSYNCAYLRIQAQAVDYESISSLRNTFGEKYYACLRCKPEKRGVVYITAGGNSYHSRSDCASLMRTVYMIPLSSADEYGACSKCTG